ncbi:MAG: beta-N-acetylhexosaminidase, partial [Muribaculaceae bacterium]|nr:beta-N-acetylhexosaminidase [Muribaculaceae bacterium]
MKKARIVLAILMTMVVMCAKAQVPLADYRVVPLPERIDGIKDNVFNLTEARLIDYPMGNRAMERNAILLSQYIEEQTGIHLSTHPILRGDAGSISLELDATIEGDEAYRISIHSKYIKVSGKTPAGVFYGIQTLRKSLPVGNFKTVNLPAAQVASSPRFPYRGMHLDCSRHFFTVETVKRYIDIMALHGMNRLHWHLTDDQGWRIEIKKYPRLTEVGGWRKGTVLGHNSPVNDGIRHGGYYTQAEIRDIVQYAAERYITIIPEIDMPGHMLGALAAYPELGCSGGPYEVWGMWGVSNEI